MKRARKLLIPSILTCALLAALAVATTASAEIRVGEATRPADPALPQEGDIIGARAEYDSDTGAVTFKLTTVRAPSPGTVEDPNELGIAAGLVKPSICGLAAIGSAAFPNFSIQYQYVQPKLAAWWFYESANAQPAPPETLGPVVVVPGATTTLTAVAPIAANLPFDCAAVVAHTNGIPVGEPLVFPIAVPPPADTPSTPTQDQGQGQATGTQAPSPTPSKAAPAALAIAKPKPLKLKPGKWKTVKITVANPGGTATAPGSLRLKAPAGVLVKPERQKLPVLTAGKSWTVSAKVQLTVQAKKKSTVTLTAAAGGLTAKGSLVLKYQD